MQRRVGEHLARAMPWGLNDPEKSLWSIYHTFVLIGCGLWPKFYGSFGLQLAFSQVIPVLNMMLVHAI